MELFFEWTLKELGWLLEPYSYIATSINNEQWADITDFKIENMSAEDAGYHFLSFWLAWPLLVAINFPLAILLSPILIVRALLKLGELFVLALLDGKDINKHVDDAKEMQPHHYTFDKAH